MNLDADKLMDDCMLNETYKRYDKYKHIQIDNSPTGDKNLSLVAPEISLSQSLS